MELTFSPARRMAAAGNGARDARVAMSIVEIHSDTVHDLLSATAYRRLEVKAVRHPFLSPLIPSLTGL